jgi:nucleobase:cation symporter-1, NCS1 family
MHEPSQSSGDQVWSIELHGIDAISTQERHGTPFELFWIWFAGNIGIVSIIYGGIIASAGLNFWQCLFVVLLGSLVSFALVGVVSLAGVWGGAPMLTLSRAVFGPRGNIIPTIISWLSLVGWDTVAVITAAYAALGLFRLAGLPSNTLWTIISLIIVVLLVIPVSLFGHATLVWIQRVATWLFGIMTVVIGVFLIYQTNWAHLFALPSGPWDSGVLTTLSITLVGGLGSINMGADYTRYLPRNSSSGAIIGWTILGYTLPTFGLSVVGFLLASRFPNLASTTDPVQLVRSALPAWMQVPYLMTAVGGLVAGSALNLYSSGLNLLAIGVKLKRYKTVLIDGVLIIAGSIYVMLIAQNFLRLFEGFLPLLAYGLTAWGAVFLVDMLVRRGYDARSLDDTSAGSRYFYWRGVNPVAVGAWLVGILVGLAFTGIFASIGPGYLIGFLVSGVLYAVLMRFYRVRETLTE